MALTNTQAQNTAGGIQAAAIAIRTGFSISAMVDQYRYAKANIRHQIAMSKMAFNHNIGKINFQSETMGQMKELAERHNKGAVDLVKSQSNLQVAEAELAQVKMTNKSAKLAKAKAFKSVLNKRRPYSYGHTWG